MMAVLNFQVFIDHWLRQEINASVNYVEEIFLQCHMTALYAARPGKVFLQCHVKALYVPCPGQFCCQLDTS